MFDFAVIGIDPGSKSGLAIICCNNSMFRRDVFPSRVLTVKCDSVSVMEKSFFDLIGSVDVGSIKSIYVAIEDQYMFLNANTMKQISRNSGIWQAIAEMKIQGACVEYYLPAEWQKDTKPRGGGRMKRNELAKFYYAYACSIAPNLQREITIDSAAALCIAHHCALKKMIEVEREIM